MLARSGALIVATLFALVCLAGPALAHGRGSDATNFDATVRTTPDLPGITWQVYGSDEYLGVTNTSDQELVVLGYEGEPYLRVGPDGVFANRRSEATYLNADRYQRVSVPPIADNDAEPEWVRVSDGPTFLWHDHRIHWMSLAVPPPVQDNPGEEVVVIDGWEVPFTVGGETLAITGDLRWVPGPSPWPWLGGALLVLLPVLAALRTQPVSEDRWPGLARPAAAVLGALAAANLIHLADDLFAVPLPLPTVLFAAAQTVLFILIAAFGALRGWQAREGAFTAIGVGSAALLVGQGLLYFGVLTTSQTETIFPELLTRAVVALSIVQAIPLGIIAVMGTRRLLPPLDEETEPVSEAAQA
jgi:hypothetical protein